MGQTTGGAKNEAVCITLNFYHYFPHFFIDSNIKKRNGAYSNERKTHYFSIRLDADDANMDRHRPLPIAANKMKNDQPTAFKKGQALTARLHLASSRRAR